MTWVLAASVQSSSIPSSRNSVYLPAVIEIHHGHQKPRKSIFILQEYQSSYPPPLSFNTQENAATTKVETNALKHKYLCLTVEDSENGPSVKSTVFSFFL